MASYAAASDGIIWRGEQAASYNAESFVCQALQTDNLVRELLNVCGGVRSWKRVMDPENNQPKRFGFCEFEDAEGVLRAMRILDGGAAHLHAAPLSLTHVVLCLKPFKLA
jgi:hypothetical protein